MSVSLLITGLVIHYLLPIQVSFFSCVLSVKMMFHSLSNSALAFAALAAGHSVLQFDGRVPAGTPLTAFDAPDSKFNPSNVFGKGLKPSQLLQLPAVAPSLFDVGTIPLEVTIR